MTDKNEFDQNVEPNEGQKFEISVKCVNCKEPMSGPVFRRALHVVHYGWQCPICYDSLEINFPHYPANG